MISATEINALRLEMVDGVNQFLKLPLISYVIDNVKTTINQVTIIARCMSAERFRFFCFLRSDRMVLRVHRLDEENTDVHSKTDQSRLRPDVHGGRQRTEVSRQPRTVSVNTEHTRGRLRSKQTFGSPDPNRRQSNCLSVAGTTRRRRSSCAIRKKAYWNWNRSCRSPGTRSTKRLNTKYVKSWSSSGTRARHRSRDTVSFVWKHFDYFSMVFARQEIPEYKAVTKLLSMFAPSNVTFWFLYYNLMPLTDYTNWLPPFRGTVVRW